MKAENELINLLVDRRVWRGLPMAVLLLFIATNIQFRSWQRALAQKAQENLLITPTAAPVAPEKARFDRSVGQETQLYFPSIPNATTTKLVVLSGMSQNFSNQYPKAGDQTIPEWLDDWLQTRGARAWGFAAPNLTYEEAVFQLVTLLTNPHTKPFAFISGACFDKFRNVDVREGYLQILRDRPEVLAEWKSAAERYAAKYPQASAKMLSTLASLHAEATGAQTETSFDTRLRDRLARYVPIIDMRKELNSQLQLGLFVLRNALFNIKPNSKRPVIESRYELNQQFLSLLVDLGHEQDVKVMIYVVPLNPLGDNPYVPAQYAAFKKWVEEFARVRGVPFANLENAVPEQFWGAWLGGRDFKHFKGEGHRLTADAIEKSFGPLIVGDAAR